VGEFGGVGVLDENTDTHEFPHFTSPMVWKIVFFLQQETEKKREKKRISDERRAGDVGSKLLAKWRSVISVSYRQC
jgi:hypothetical protein